MKPSNKYYLYSKGAHMNFLSLFFFKEGGLEKYSETMNEPTPSAIKSQKMSLYHIDCGKYLFEFIEMDSPYYIQFQYTFKK